MLAKKKKILDAWVKLASGPLKIICRDPNGALHSRVRCNGVDYYSDVVEIEGESTISLRTLDGQNNVFCVCTTTAVNVLR